MFQKVLMFLFATKTALVSCHYEARKIDMDKVKTPIVKLGKMDALVKESSGICQSPWSENLLSINDSGGKPEIYEINPNGKIVKTHPVPNSKNVDWEEITTDTRGNVYIGDFGNNSNKRKDLTIYKYKNGITDKITFTFADQDLEKDGKMEYDCEAFFWNNDSLYLFTKSWEKGVKASRIYSLSDQPGDYSLSPKDEIYFKAQITGAAISPSRKQYALMSYGKIFFFGVEDNRINFRSPDACISIAKKQTEAIMYQNAGSILFTNEQRGLYQFNLPK
jgi:hypothetical protein